MKIPFLLCLLITYFLHQAQDTVKIDALSFEAAYTLDGAANFSGGYKTGAKALGMVDFALSINTKELGLWKGGTLYAQFENTHGGTPSGDLVGDFQAFDNIENGNASYLYMLWYKQKLGILSIILGVHDLNSEFVASEYGGNFINSSFGIMPTASLNFPVSIFPKNALGAILQCDITEKINFQTALYDGDPGSLDVDMYNTKWTLSKDEGVLSVSELRYSSEKDEQTNSSYKLGFIYHSGEFVSLKDTNVAKKGNCTSSFCIRDWIRYSI